MSEMLFLCPLAMAHGFRLAGVSVREVNDYTEALQLVKTLRGTMKSGLVILPEQYFKQFGRRDKQDLAAEKDPLFVPVPLEWREKDDFKVEFSEMIKSIVGFKVPLTSKILKAADNNEEKTIK